MKPEAKSQSAAQIVVISAAEADTRQGYEGFGVAVPIHTAHETTHVVRGRLNGFPVHLRVVVDSAWGDESRMKVRRVRVTVERVQDAAP